MNVLIGMIGFSILLTVFLAYIVGYRCNKLEKIDSALQTQIDDLKRELEEMKRK